MKDSMLIKITAFFWDIFCLNIIFMISNVALIVVLLFIIFHWMTLPFYVIGLFLFMLSMKALFLTIKRRNQVEENSILKQYISAYFEEFRQTAVCMIYYLLSALILGLGYISILFMNINQPVLTSAYLLLFMLLYVHFIFGVLIRVNFVIDMKGTLRLGLYCISKYPSKCLIILGITWLAILLIQLIPEVLFLGVIPFSGYIIVKTTIKVFEELNMILIDKKEISNSEFIKKDIH